MFSFSYRSGFTTDRVMKMLLEGLEHPHHEVREASLNCIFEVYKKVALQ